MRLSTNVFRNFAAVAVGLALTTAGLSTVAAQEKPKAPTPQRTGAPANPKGSRTMVAQTAAAKVARTPRPRKPVPARVEKSAKYSA